ncbi:MAG: protein-glutamate O-methyltransferase CheR [Nitrospirota bacterium]|nr:MAG: protein-glutamate O-methyltransferase CheR [Nitrospirota bacterium]
MTDAEFKLFRDLIYAECGMYLRPGNKDFLNSRVVKRMAEINVNTPYWYYRLITDGNKSELIKLLDLLTINETSFFRNKPQFDLFRKKILPDVIKKREEAGERVLRIWSAGCSTGEEPYTIAMVANEAVPKGWKVRIFASDLSLSALETANRGIYDVKKTMQEVDGYYVERYFESVGNSLRILESLKRMIVFDFHNLKLEHGLSDIDIVFCRNVMIYFDEEEHKRLIRKFHKCINDNGYLLIGHAESIQWWDSGFEFLHDKKGTAYKKVRAEKP